MQPVLVLALYPTPVSEVVAETPIAAEGAFLASFEAERPSTEGVVGSPVMLAMPVPPAILPMVDGRAEDGAGATETALAGAAGGGEARVADAAGLLLAVVEPVRIGRVAGAPLPVPDVEPRPKVVQTLAQEPKAAGEGGPAVGWVGPADPGTATHSAVDDAAWVAPQSGRGAERPEVPVSEAAWSAFEVQVRDGGQGATEAKDAPRAGGRGTSEPALSLAAQAPKAAAPVASGQSGSERQPAPAGSDLTADAPLSDQRLPVSRPEVPVERASVPVTETGDKDLAHADGDRRTPDEGRAAGRPATELAAKEDAALTGVEELKALAQASRTGLWESVFSSLARPAIVEVARVTRPVLAVPAEAPLPLAPHPDATVGAIPDQQVDPVGPQTLAPVTALATTEATKTAAPSPAPAAGFSPGATTWIITTTPDAEVDDERLPSPFAPGPVAPGVGPSSPLPSAAGPSSPVPQAAAQIVAALTRSADGGTELALSPEELGQVRLRLEPDVANPERMLVMITFERPETLDLFRRHASELAEALRAAGYAGADIGFGQDRSGSCGYDGPPSRTADGARGQDQNDPTLPPSPAPRFAAGASLDLRL